MGPDILDKTNQFDLFKQRLERKRKDTFIASALLDQKVAAGCGNYLRAECLYIAKIYPLKPIKQLTNLQMEKIWNILRQLGWYYYNEKKGKKLGIIDGKYKIHSLYKKTGPSIFKPGKGYFLVYRQSYDPHGNKVKSEKINNRMIHYVPKIQK